MVGVIIHVNPTARGITIRRCDCGERTLLSNRKAYHDDFRKQAITLKKMVTYLRRAAAVGAGSYVPWRS
jgi:hypothetical protein